MNFSAGELLFYGGIAGMAVVAVIAIVVIIVLSTGKKRLRRKFENETRNIKK